MTVRAFTDGVETDLTAVTLPFEVGFYGTSCGEVTLATGGFIGFGPGTYGFADQSGTVLAPAVRAAGWAVPSSGHGGSR